MANDAARSRLFSSMKRRDHEELLYDHIRQDFIEALCLKQDVENLDRALKRVTKND